MFQNEDLRELDQKFLVIPPQVFTVEVSGLQDFGESDTLLNQLNQNLLGKPLAAMVENRTAFQKKLECDGTELPKLIFFDTSTEDVDININQKLIEFIGKDLNFDMKQENIQMHILSTNEFSPTLYFQ